MEKELNIEEVEVKEETTEEVTKEEVKTFTEEEVEKMIQQETDRKVTKALQTSQQKWEQEYLAKLEAEKSEAEKLAKMSEEERYQAKLQAEREQFEAERKEFMQQKMAMQTIKELDNNELPTAFADYLIADDAETVKSNIENFKELWVKALEDEVNKRLKGKTPSTSTKATVTVTPEEFKNMDFQERLQLHKDNPELYKELTK